MDKFLILPKEKYIQFFIIKFIEIKFKLKIIIYLYNK